jgi:indolepyruvate ferredoxin oxidoreductase
MKKKVSLGPWFRPAFAARYAMRRLRGTAADPFGRTTARRTERRLIGEDRALVRSPLPKLIPGNHAAIAEILALPDVVCGHERSSRRTSRPTWHS